MEENLGQEGLEKEVGGGENARAKAGCKRCKEKNRNPLHAD
jgi:hypothetical protein